MNWNGRSDAVIPTVYTTNRFADLVNTSMSIQDSINAFQNAAIAQHFGSLQSEGCCTSLRDSEPIYVDGVAGAMAYKLPKNKHYVTLHDRYSDTIYIKYENDNINTYKYEEKEREKMLMDNNTKNPMSEMMNPAAMFNGIFGRVAPDMCRISMSGQIAVHTPNGYKSYNVETGRLTNCSSFAFNIGEDAFFVIPTNKVMKGDIILINGKPHCVLSTSKNRIDAFCYEDSSVHTVVPEHHVFMGRQYLYGKIISLFGDIGKGSGLKKMMGFMMLSQMMKGPGAGDNNGMSAMFPMMLMMNGGGTGSILDGMFDFGDDEDEDSEDAGEDGDA